jgi:hypothetical protein
MAGAKECVACAEEILIAAKLCKHCGTTQDDPRFTFQESQKKEKKMKTKFKARCLILSDLWLNYRDDEQFEEFIKYNDLGLPLAYAISEGIVVSTDTAKGFVDEAFDLLLAGINAKDTGFENVDDVLAAEDTA